MSMSRLVSSQCHFSCCRQISVRKGLRKRKRSSASYYAVGSQATEKHCYQFSNEILHPRSWTLSLPEETDAIVPNSEYRQFYEYSCFRRPLIFNFSDTIESACVERCVFSAANRPRSFGI